MGDILGFKPLYGFIVILSSTAVTALLVVKASGIAVSWWWITGLASPAIIIFILSLLGELGERWLHKHESPLKKLDKLKSQYKR